MSACPSRADACASSFSRSGSPSARAAAAASPASVAAALLPSPRARGIRLSDSTRRSPGRYPVSSKTAYMATKTGLVSSHGSDSEPSPTKDISTPDPGNSLTMRVWWRASANPMQSKPGPRLAVDAGTVTRILTPARVRSARTVLQSLG